MKVYIVQQYEADYSSEIMGVFATLELAEQYSEDDNSVEEYEVVEETQ